MEPQRRVVPWFSMSEWLKVYQQLYSDNPTEQISGCETLLTWRARCNKLPPGVECTLHLSQVMTQYGLVQQQRGEGGLSVYHDQDLRLMYSTALLRFTNHMSTLGQNQESLQSMFDVAENLGIPGWVISLRHQCTHKELPSLEALKSAVKFAFMWLHENYWKEEAEKTHCWVNEEKKTLSHEVENMCNRLTDLLQKYAAVRTHRMADINLVSQIDDTNFRQYLEILHDSKSRKKKKVEHRHFFLSDAEKLLKKNIERVVSEVSWERRRVTLLLDAILTSGALVPTHGEIKDFVDYDISEGSGIILPVKLVKLWADVVKIFQFVGWLPLLLEQLIELVYVEQDKDRQTVAVGWIIEILKALIRTKTVLAKTVNADSHQETKNKGSFAVKTKNKGSCAARSKKKSASLKKKSASLKKKKKMQWQNWPKKKTKMQFEYVFCQNIKSQEEDTYGLHLMYLSRAKGRDWLQLLRKAVDMPNIWTSHYLPLIFELMRPPVNDDVKSKLLKLVEIYTGINGCEVGPKNVKKKGSASEEIYTVGMLKEKHQAAKVQSQREATSSVIDGMKWNLCTDYVDWSSYPLGLLPSQQKFETLDLKLHCTWKQKQPVLATEVFMPQLSEKKIDWESFSNRTRKKSCKNSAVAVSPSIQVKRKKKSKENHEEQNTKLVDKMRGRKAKREN